jgi:hypothetical protein
MGTKSVCRDTPAPSWASPDKKPASRPAQVAGKAAVSVHLRNQQIDRSTDQPDPSGEDVGARLGPGPRRRRPARVPPRRPGHLTRSHLVCGAKVLHSSRWATTSSRDARSRRGSDANLSVAESVLNRFTQTGRHQRACSPSRGARLGRVPWIVEGWVSKPDSDGRDVDGSLVDEPGGRPPKLGRPRRPVIWLAGSGIVVLLPLLRSEIRILRVEYALSAATRPGLAWGGVAHDRAAGCARPS